MCMIENAEEYWDSCEIEHLTLDGLINCDECARPLSPGELIKKVTGTGNGGVDVFYTCAHCQVAERWLERECGGFLSGGVYEDIEDHVGERVYGYDLARLHVGMRRKWNRKDGQLMPIPRMPKTTPQIVAA